MRLLTIARLTFLEARHRKMLRAIAILGLVFLAVYAVGFYFVHREITREVSPGTSELFGVTDFFTLAGLYVVNFLTVMLAVLLSVDSIAGEIASGTLHTIVTKPIRRWEVVLGKWLGIAGILSIFTLSMSTAVVLVIWAIGGYRPPSPTEGILLMLLGGFVLLSLSILGGTRLSTLTNGVVVFMLYGLSFIAGWVEQVGAAVRNETAVDIGISISLLIPVEAMWKRASYIMEPSFLHNLGLHPFASVSAPNNVMVTYAAFYVAVALAAAVRSFQKRDL